MSVGPGGSIPVGQGSFSDSSVNSTNQATVRLSAQGSRGDIRLNVRLEVGGDAVVGGGRPAEFRLSNTGGISNQADNIIDRARGQLPGQIRLAAVASGITSDVNSIVNRITSLNGFSISGNSIGRTPPGVSVINNIRTRELREPVFGPPRIGFPEDVDTEITYALGLNFDPIRLPASISVGGETIFQSNITNRFPEIEIEHGLPGGGFLGPPPVFASVGIPPEAYIEPVNVDVSCGQIFGGSPSSGQIGIIGAAANTARQNARDSLNTLQSVKSDIENTLNIRRATLPTSVSEIRNIIGQRSTPPRQKVREWESQVRSVNLDPTGGGDSINSLRRRLNDLDIPSQCEGFFDIDSARQDLNQAESLIDRATNLKRELQNFIETLLNAIDLSVRAPCAQEFGSIDSQITSLEQDANSLLRDSPRAPTRSAVLAQILQLEQQVQNIDDNACVNQFTSRLQSLRNRLSGQRRGPRDRFEDAIDCTEAAPSDLLNEIDTFVANAREFSRQREIQRTGERFNQLINQGESLQSRIRNEVSESQCVQQLQGRVSSAMSRLQSTGARRQSIIPCGEQHPDIDTQVDEFEDQVTNLTAPIEPQTLQDVTSQGQDIIESIEANIPPGRCREEFVSRIRSATSLLQGLQERVQVTVVEDAGDGAEESLNQLLEQIQRIEVRRAEGFTRENRDTIL